MYEDSWMEGHIGYNDGLTNGLITNIEILFNSILELWNESPPDYVNSPANIGRLQ